MQESFVRGRISSSMMAEVQRAVLSTASNVNIVSNIRGMAIVNPEERASAAEMLVKHFNEESGPSSHNQSSFASYRKSAQNHKLKVKA